MPGAGRGDATDQGHREVGAGAPTRDNSLMVAVVPWPVPFSELPELSPSEGGFTLCKLHLNRRSGGHRTIQSSPKQPRISLAGSGSRGFSGNQRCEESGRGDWFRGVSAPGPGSTREGGYLNPDPALLGGKEVGKPASVRLPPGRRRKPSGPGVCAGEGERRGLAQEAGRPDGWSPAPNDGGPSARRAGGEVRSRSRSWEKRAGAAPRDAAREAFALSAAWPDDAIRLYFQRIRAVWKMGWRAAKMKLGVTAASWAGDGTKRKLWGLAGCGRGREERGLQDHPRGSSLHTAACTVIPDGVGPGLHVRRSAGLGEAENPAGVSGRQFPHPQDRKQNT